MNGVTAELVRAYASVFVHVWDYYAVQQRDGSYRPAYQPLSLSRLSDHLLGRYTLGTYVVDRVGQCSFAVFDADEDEGYRRLALLADWLAEQGISFLIELSRRGWHVWVCFERAARASRVRWWLGPVADALGVELYPKRDVVRPGGVGSLMRLPLGVHRVSGERYPFVVLGDNGLLLPVGGTVLECCAWVCERVERVAVPLGDDAADVVSLADGREEMGGDGSEGVSGWGQRGAIRAWCRSQDIVEVIGQYVELDRRGVGRCPLPGHHYRGDMRPSFQVFGGHDPHWYCYTWGRAGDLFDFLRLYHGLTVREAWERLQQGRLY